MMAENNIQFSLREYTKWISNNGTINQARVIGNELMPTFAHWTWVKSREQLLVCDLQGVKIREATTESLWKVL